MAISDTLGLLFNYLLKRTKGDDRILKRPRRHGSGKMLKKIKRIINLKKRRFYAMSKMWHSSPDSAGRFQAEYRIGTTPFNEEI
jgi:hypothetical protein